MEDRMKLCKEQKLKDCHWKLVAQLYLKELDFDIDESVFYSNFENENLREKKLLEKVEESGKDKGSFVEGFKVKGEKAR